MKFVGTVLTLITISCGMPGCDSTTSTSFDGTLSTSPNSTIGSVDRPLRVLLIPADGGTEEGTIADFEPIFKAITKDNDLHFDIKVGQSYNAVVEGMVNEKVDVAWFGPVSYNLAKQRGAAEFLAVGVKDGQSVYYSGIFVNSIANFAGLTDLKGKSIAFGDLNSTSSFNFPVAMLLDAGIDPANDLSHIYFTGSHANSLAALAAGKVDAACASYTSFEKAVTNGQIDPDQIIPLVKSDPIPYPPMAMHVKLPDSLKERLRRAFDSVHEADGIRPEMIRGYGGKMIDRYSTDFSEEEFDKSMAMLAAVTDELKEELLKKASQGDK